MDITIGIRVLEAALFGLVFSAVSHLIGGSFTWRAWLADAVWLAGLAYLILFGAIQV